MVRLVICRPLRYASSISAVERAMSLMRSSSIAPLSVPDVPSPLIWNWEAVIAGGVNPTIPCARNSPST